MHERVTNSRNSLYFALLAGLLTQLHLSFNILKFTLSGESTGVGKLINLNKHIARKSTLKLST